MRNAGFGSFITEFAPWGASTYHGLQTQLQRRLSNGLTFQAAWTWSHLIDNSTADFHSTDISPRRPQDFQDLPAERANSILDHAHRITMAVIYDAPWFAHDSSWIKRNVLGNYEFAPIYTWESGQWGTVQSADDANLNADAAPDRAIYNPAGQKGVGSDIIPLTNSAGSDCCLSGGKPERTVHYRWHGCVSHFVPQHPGDASYQQLRYHGCQTLPVWRTLRYRFHGAGVQHFQPPAICYRQNQRRRERRSDWCSQELLHSEQRRLQQSFAELQQQPANHAIGPEVHLLSEEIGLFLVILQEALSSLLFFCALTFLVELISRTSDSGWPHP